MPSDDPRRLAALPEMTDVDERLVQLSPAGELKDEENPLVVVEKSQPVLICSKIEIKVDNRWTVCHCRLFHYFTWLGSTHRSPGVTHEHSRVLVGQLMGTHGKPMGTR